MTSRERVQRALRFTLPDRVPMRLKVLSGIMDMVKDDIPIVKRKFDFDFAGPSFRYGEGRRKKGNYAEVGHYTDEWGCIWYVGERGMAGLVKESPLEDLSGLDDYELPWEVLNEADFTQVNKGCESTDKFVHAPTLIRPFERMQFLCGTEQLFVELASGEGRIYKLRDMLHEFHLTELEMWCNTDVDSVFFQDDWGTQTSLLVSPALWREFYKPLYKDYCDIIHQSGKFAIFHSDGNIEAIMPDLVEIGVDAILSQLFCMDIEELGRKYKGKITFWGEIDRQYILPFGTEEDVRNAVKRAADALYLPEGGVIAQCEWGKAVPRKNIEAVYDEWMNISRERMIKS